MTAKKRLVSGVAIAAAGLCVLGVGAWAGAAAVNSPSRRA